MTGIDLGPGPAAAVIDVGGTEIKASVLDGAGRLGPVSRRPTPTGPHVVDEVVDAIAAHVDAARRQVPDLASVGLVVPGIVDAARGVAVFSENLGWRDVPFRDLVAERTGLAVGFGHDVASAGRAEVELGAARGCGDVAVIVIGTGIAAALFTDGRPWLGGGWAGELGHSVVADDGPLCVCGAVGCLEAIASTAAIARAYREATGTAVEGSREVLRRAEAGDPAARTVWATAVGALAAGIRQVAALLAPQVVVLGGGLSIAGSALMQPLAAAVHEVIGPHREPELRLAAFSGHAGLSGAALLSREAAA